MMQLFGTVAALVILYIGTSMIVLGKTPPRAAGLLGLVLIAPSALYMLGDESSFVQGFGNVLALTGFTVLSLRLLLGKRLFSSLIMKPLSKIAHAWFNRKGRKNVHNV